MAKQDQLILVAIRGLHTQIVFGPAMPQICGAKRKELKTSGNWKNWSFELRSLAGYLKVPILGKKTELTYEEKIERIKL